MKRTLGHTTPIVLTLLAGLAPGAIAQDQPGSAEQVKAAEEILPRVGTNTTPVMPTTPAVSEAIQPGLGEGPDWLKVLNDTLETHVGASTLAEGSFVLARLGDLVEAPTSQLIFVPDHEQREAGEGAVILLPSRALERLQDEWSGQRVLISGEILTYHNRNMLLVSDYRLVRESEPSTPESEVTEPDASQEPTEDPATGIEDDPEVKDLLRELERPDPNDPRQDALSERLEALPRTPDRDTSTATSGPPEGTLLLRRPARMVRNAQGAWSIVFDNDDPASAQADALTVLPCRALMRMEQYAMDQGDAARFLVSGRVYSYRGESFLLPTIAQRLGESDINSIQ
ncbi:MAG: hypothetical protein KDA29_07345 [Phycisphaerales bacterium]|nr:hypothetical protein [Phycisphaerales bacterium]